MISNTNIRATAFKEFWGDKYDKYLYIWEGSKNNQSIEEIKNSAKYTHSDLFKSERQITNAVGACKELYDQYLPILAKQLNKYHSLDLSEKFWQISLAYWLPNHISIIYEKFSYLNNFDFDHCDLKILSESSYYIPNEYIDYCNLVNGDFGVQQLVSDYCRVFYPSVFEEIDKEFSYDELNWNIPQRTKEKDHKKTHKTYTKIKGLIRFLVKPKQMFWFLCKKFLKFKVGLLFAIYPEDFINKLEDKSLRRIRAVKLPNVLGTAKSDLKGRKELFGIKSERPLDQYFYHSLIFALPKFFLEEFKDKYLIYSKDIEKQRFKYLLSEGWIGFSAIAIYFATAYEQGISIICQEHSASRIFQKNNTLWIDQKLEEIFITTGWESVKSNEISGGFASRDLPSYKFIKDSNDILVIGNVRSYYLNSICHTPQNSNAIDEIKAIDRLFKTRPDCYKEKYIYRPRYRYNHWDTTKVLNLESRGIRIDNGEMYDSIINSRIVILDHLSTALAELILIGVPFIILLHNHIAIEGEYLNIFRKLEKVGVIQRDEESINQFIEDNYDTIQQWWQEESLITTVNEFGVMFYGSSNLTEKYLLSLT